MAGTSFQNRRGTAAQWRTANPVLKPGEFGIETDTGVVKEGDGANGWNALSPILGSTYLPILGKAADSDKLDGHDSTEFLLKTEATSTYLSQVNAGNTYVAASSAVSANTPNAVVRRDANGAFATSAITGLTTPASDDSAANRKFVTDSLTIFGRDRGSGTALPSTDLRRGDVFYWTSISSLMRYDGVIWKQAAEGSGVVATYASLPSATSLYEGMQVFVTSRNTMYRIWKIGTTPTLTWKQASPYCRLVLEGDMSMGAGNDWINMWSTNPTFNGIDLDGMAPNSGATNQFATVQVPGLYDIYSVLHLTGASGIFLVSRITKNGNANAGTPSAGIGFEDRTIDSSNEGTLNLTMLGVPLVAGDKISNDLYVNSGTPILRRAATFTNNLMYTRLILEYRGPIPQTGT